MKRMKALLMLGLAVAAACIASPATAQYIVHDPTSYGTLGQIFTNAQETLKVENNIYGEAMKTVSQLTNIYSSVGKSGSITGGGLQALLTIPLDPRAGVLGQTVNIEDLRPAPAVKGPEGIRAPDLNRLGDTAGWLDQVVFGNLPEKGVAAKGLTPTNAPLQYWENNKKDRETLWKDAVKRCQSLAWQQQDSASRSAQRSRQLATGAKQTEELRSDGIFGNALNMAILERLDQILAINACQLEVTTTMQSKDWNGNAFQKREPNLTAGSDGVGNEAANQVFGK